MNDNPVGLTAHRVSVSFEGLTALAEVSVTLRQHEILGLIGPNGAGKTTLVNVLTGFQEVDSGSLSVDGQSLLRVSPHRYPRLGVARTFQSVRLFGNLSVLENVEVAAVASGLGRHVAREKSLHILNWMSFPSDITRPAKTLPYGSERMVGFARALATTPRYLLLDEPAAGLSEPECDLVMNIILELPKAFNCGVLLIEHNIELVMNTCERLCVLDGGRVLAEGPTMEVRRNPLVIDAYLGSDREEALEAGGASA
jgi:branched-chain amino acid transport system ATP-binding protein